MEVVVDTYGLSKLDSYILISSAPVFLCTISRDVVDSNDADIREALHRKVLQPYHKCSSTIVVDELGLAHGKNRVDIAVLNGCVHGYEIKSSKDNLLRFSAQLEEYTRSLQKLTVVSAPNHIEDVLNVVPDWCGVVQATMGPRGGVAFSTLRRATKNPNVDAVALAHLLWRKEAVEFLELLGVTGKSLTMPRKALYEEIASQASLNELVAWIKDRFMRRDSWRADLQLA